MKEKKHKFNKLDTILDESSILKNMVFVLKSGTLVSRKSAGLNVETVADPDVYVDLDKGKDEQKHKDKDIQKHNEGPNDIMLKIDTGLVKEYDLVLEFASLSSAGLAKICEESIYVETSYIDWIFEYLAEIGEQESFGGLFRRI